MRASNCKYETPNGRCGLKGSYAYRHKCFTEDLCKCHDPMTNADRIRAMSDEELAEFIKNIKVRAVFCKAAKNNDAFDELCSAEWLQQPAETDDETD